MDGSFCCFLQQLAKYFNKNTELVYYRHNLLPSLFTIQSETCFSFAIMYSNSRRYLCSYIPSSGFLLKYSETVFPRISDECLLMADVPVENLKWSGDGTSNRL